MKNTERSGFLSANDEKRPTGSTTRTPFAKWGRAGVDSLLDLLPSDRSEELLGLGIKPRPWLHRSFMALSARRSLKREKGSVALALSRDIYIGARGSTLAHNISFERSSYGEPQQLQIPPKAPFNELL